MQKNSTSTTTSGGTSTTKLTSSANDYYCEKIMRFFKNKITLLDLNGGIIEEYYSKFKPSIGEYIYSDKNSCYYVVKQVVHSLKSGGRLLAIVENIEL